MKLFKAFDYVPRLKYGIRNLTIYWIPMHRVCVCSSFAEVLNGVSRVQYWAPPISKCQ